MDNQETQTTTWGTRHRIKTNKTEKNKKHVTYPKKKGTDLLPSEI